MSATLVAYAVNADGYPVHRAELHDGGVWITNQSLGAVGRQNVPVAQIDARVFDGGAFVESPELDVLQAGSAVVSRNRASGSLMPIDVSMGVGLEEQRVDTAGEDAFLGGRSLGVLDRESGKLWATSVDPETGAMSLSDLTKDARPLATSGEDAVGAVGSDGTVYAASTAAAQVVTLRPVAGSTGFEKPVKESLAAEREGALTAMTVVGDVPVLVDGRGNLLTRSQDLGEIGLDAELQLPGPAADDVLVATPKALLAVPLSGGTPRTVADVGNQESVSAPVVMPNGCTFAAWSAGESGTLATTCGGEVEVYRFDVKAGAELVFRVNRNQVVLNDEKSGMTWEVMTSEPQMISNWDAYKPEPEKKGDKNARTTEAQTTRPPQAKDDELGARAGRTTVLNVLDNDLIATDGILSIVDVAGVTDKAVEVRVAPDRQSLLATVDPGASGSVHFTYTIDDGTKGKSSQDDGEVTLRIRTDDESGTPTLRPSAPKRTFPVTAGGVVEFAVTPDWRDYDYGDPVVVTSVKGGGDLEVSTTALGLVRVVAPARSAGGTHTVTYEVTTGGDVERGSVPVRVVPAGTTTVPATAEPDVVSGEEGAPITVRPLDNDIPGADGSDPGARLVLSGKVAPIGGLEVDTDLESGRVTVTGSPGSYLLAYSAGFGAARRAAGQVRVDITPASTLSDIPVAAPDNANVHGMSPSIVDVLANDYDPKGRMLAVQNARPSSDESQLEVAVIDGRWIRVSATDPEIMPASQSVVYTVSNGVNEVKGSINLTQRPALTGIANTPVTQVDRVTVRAGDTASIPVLDNDTTPSGDPVGLVLDRSRTSTGELVVLPSTGTAYVAGRRVRFVAPENLTGAADVDVQYVVENTGDPTAPTAIGTVKVHITAPPSKTNPNQAPTPRALEGRVVQGDVVTLKLPPVGVDPDGDSVAITGIETPPRYGRVVASGANSLTYQAYPDSAGTDEFRYTVTDRYGATASATARVGVVSAGTPQAPLAVDDTLAAAPGRTVDVDLLANDMRSPGTDVRILDLPGAPKGAKLRSETGPMAVVAPEDGRTTRVVYTITNGLEESRGVVAVTGVEGFNNPPTVEDLYATPEPGVGTVEVDVLGAAFDVDGPEDELELVDVTGDGLAQGETGVAASAEEGGDAEAPRVRVEGGTVVVTLSSVAQVLAYRVQDKDGAAAAAAIYVPAKPQDTPYLKPGAEITLDPDSSTSVDLEDLVIDPEGDAVRLTMANTLSASPEKRLSVTAEDTTSLKVTAAKGEGPGAVVFEVSDRKDLEATDAHKAFISVPVQVGDPNPQVTCPDDAIEVPEGGISPVVDIASICHVWMPDSADAHDLEFTAAWAKDAALGGVSAESVKGGGIRLEASTDARRGERGVLDVAVAGDEPTGRLQVVVVELPEPTLAPIRLDTEVGKPITVDVAQYLTSPIPADKRDIEIVDVSGPGEASATPTWKGSTVTFTPRKGGDGVMTYRLAVSDVGPDLPGGRAPAVGQVQLAVTGAPDAPTDLRIGAELLSKTVALTWAAPDSNGARIDRYEVSYDGGTFVCPGSPCRVTGLDNGRTYSFSVKAHNAVGWSGASKAVKGKADAFTGPVRNPRVLLQRDTSIEVAWDAPADCDCSAVQKYQISAPGTLTRVDAGTRRFTVPAVNGEKVTITIVPLNDKGLQENTGPTNSVVGMAAGAPTKPDAPRLTPEDVLGGSQTSVTVVWGPVAANGPAPVLYQVMRDDQVVCGWREATRCSDAGITNDGRTHTYQVRAKNAEADSVREQQAGGSALHVSPWSSTASVEASAPPARPVINSTQATGRSGEARISFTAGPSHGATNKITCSVGSCSWSGSRNGGSGTLTVTGLPNSPTSIQLVACNGSQTTPCTSSEPKTVSAYGEIGAVSVSATNSGQDVTWKIAINPNGKAATWTLRRRHTQFDLWVHVDRGSTGTGAYAKSGPDYVSEQATYIYRLTVTDPGRATRTDDFTLRVGNVAGETISADKGQGCGSGCWHIDANANGFRNPNSSTCSVIAGSKDAPGDPIGDPWTQYNDRQDTGVRIHANEQFFIRCANGAVSRWYKW